MNKKWAWWSTGKSLANLDFHIRETMSHRELNIIYWWGDQTMGTLRPACFFSRVLCLATQARALDSLLHLSRLSVGQRLGTTPGQIFAASAFSSTDWARAPAERWCNVRLHGASAVSKHKQINYVVVVPIDVVLNLATRGATLDLLPNRHWYTSLSELPEKCNIWDCFTTKLELKHMCHSCVSSCY